MKLTGVALSAFAVALTCGTGAAFAQQDFHQGRGQRPNPYHDGDDRRGANDGYANYGGYAVQYARPVYGYGAYGDGARIYAENERVQTYYNRDDEERFRRDDRRNEYRGDEEPDRR